MERKVTYSKVQFSELSWPVKVGIIGGWAVLVLYTFAFIFGMITASMAL